MTPEEKLDKILLYLFTEYTKGKIPFEHSKNICINAGLNISPTESYLILLKLNSDGYVDMSDSNQWLFQINYNGILFFNSGGYYQELKDLKRKRVKNDIYNVVVGLGTFLAGLYALLQFLKEILTIRCLFFLNIF